MEEAKQRRMLLRSSIQTKPFSNLTPQTPSLSQSKKHNISSQNPHSPDDWVGDGNLMDTRKPIVVSLKEKKVVTPINFGAMKKAKEGSCQHTLRTRSEVEGVEDGSQTKSSTYPLQNKKRRWPSKESVKKFVDQQNAYFKEIDEYDLEVEEVE